MINIEELKQLIKDSNSLIFNPIHRFFKSGNEIHIVSTIYMGVSITHRTYFPYNVLKDPIDLFLVDIILPIDYKLEKGSINDGYYTEIGYGYPEFNSLLESMSFIKNYKK